MSARTTMSPTLPSNAASNVCVTCKVDWRKPGVCQGCDKPLWLVNALLGDTQTTLRVLSFPVLMQVRPRTQCRLHRIGGWQGWKEGS